MASIRSSAASCAAATTGSTAALTATSAPQRPSRYRDLGGILHRFQAGEIPRDFINLRGKECEPDTNTRIPERCCEAAGRDNPNRRCLAGHPYPTPRGREADPTDRVGSQLLQKLKRIALSGVGRSLSIVNLWESTLEGSSSATRSTAAIATWSAGG